MHTERPGVLARIVTGLVLTATAGFGVALAAAPASAGTYGASSTSGAVTTDADGISSAGMATRAPGPRCGKSGTSQRVPAGCKRTNRR